MNRILFICKKRCSYGKSYGLINSAGFVVNYLNSVGFNARLEMAEDSNQVDKLVTDFDPECVIIEALWVPAEKLKEILKIKRHKKRLWVVRLHSKISFIANEGIAFPWLLEYQKLNLENLWIAPNTQEFSDDLLNIFGINSMYLPNIYCPTNYDFKKSKKEKGIINIGCFGAIRPMKNHLTQAIASIKFANENNLKLNFHVNGNRSEQNGEQVLKNLKYVFKENNHKLIEHDWMSHFEFVKLIHEMDICCQVSFSETFNITACDAVWNDIPFIGSNEIPFIPNIFAVKNVNSTEEICNSLDFVWSTSGYLLKRLAKYGLNSYNKESQKVWNYFMNNMV